MPLIRFTRSQGCAWRAREGASLESARPRRGMSRSEAPDEWVFMDGGLFVGNAEDVVACPDRSFLHPSEDAFHHAEEHEVTIGL